MRRLHDLRKERGITQAELAAKLGCSQSIVSAWERGSSEPGSGAIIALAKFFEVSTDYMLELLDEFGDPPSVPRMTDDKRTLIDACLSLPASKREEAYRMICYLRDRED